MRIYTKLTKSKSYTKKDRHTKAVFFNVCLYTFLGLKRLKSQINRSVSLTPKPEPFLIIRFYTKLIRTLKFCHSTVSELTR